MNRISHSNGLTHSSQGNETVLFALKYNTTTLEPQILLAINYHIEAVPYKGIQSLTALAKL